MTRALTSEELATLKSIHSGRDVFNRAEALWFRELERMERPLVICVDTPNHYGPKDQHPYFWAMTSNAGARLLREAGLVDLWTPQTALCQVEACHKPLVATTRTGVKPFCDACWERTPVLLQMAWSALDAHAREEVARGHADALANRAYFGLIDHISDWHAKQGGGAA